MNSIKHRFTLDMHSTQSQISIPASINDTARTLYINFTDGGTPYHISEGCTALLIISKPSGVKLCEWCAIKDNTNVIYPFSQNKNTASEEGICECEITLYSAPDEDGDIEQIASPRFSIVVSERAINRGDDEVLPEASIGFIDQAVKDELVRRQKEEGRVAAENARANAETARAGAETDRANAESARATAETERASAESARKTAENARASAETARASAEGQRIANEEERQRNSAEYKAQVDLVREEISTWQDEWGKISSFDKRIENLEAAVSPGMVTPTIDDAIAYRKTVPKGVLPNAAVCEVGGMSYRCENLLNPNGFAKSSVTVVENSDGSYTITNITAVATSASQNITKKLPAGTYTIKNDSTKHLYIMTSSSDYSNSVVNGSQKTFTYDGASYLNLVFADFKANETAVVKIMLNRGSTALPYQPYFTGLRDSKVTAVESVGTNLISFPYNSNEEKINGVNWTGNPDGTVVANGTADGGNSAFYLTDELMLSAGDYVISGVPASAGYNATVTMYCVDDEGQQIPIKTSSGEYSYVNAFGDGALAITIPRRAKATIYTQVIKGSTCSNLVFKPMLNRGSTALPYTLYFRETLPIPGDALDGFGQGVNAQYYNKIVLDPLEGVKKYVKMVKKIELNGTESMSAQNYVAHFTVQQFNISGLSNIKNGIDILCNEAAAGWNAFTGNANEIAVSSGYIVIGIPKAWLTPYGYIDGTSSTYVSAFKAYLKAKYDNGTPITVAYAIATPTETDVSAYFTEDNLLRVGAGGTITAANEFEHEVPFTVEYMIKGA